MADLWRDFWISETGTGQQVAQLHDRYMMMMMMYVYVCMLACMYVRMYVCVCMYVNRPRYTYINMCMWVRIYENTYYDIFVCTVTQAVQYGVLV